MDESRASVDALGDRSGDVLADLRGALDRLHGLDPAAFRDGDTLIGLLREASRVEALACARAAAFASSDAWMPVGAQTAAAWIAVESRCDPRQVKARLRRGHALTRMDLAGAAFAAGTISVEHVDRLSRARNPRTAMVFDRDEALLVGWAKTMYFDDFVTAVDAWFYRADEDRAERLADKQHRGRRLHLSRSLENTWYLNGVFDPISSPASNANYSKPTGPKPATDWDATRPTTTSAAPPRNAAPMPWSKWPRAPRPPPGTGNALNHCSPCSSASTCSPARVSSRRARSSRPVLRRGGSTDR
jgi:hypothetical protein